MTGRTEVIARTPMMMNEMKIVERMLVEKGESLS